VYLMAFIPPIAEIRSDETITNTPYDFSCSYPDVPRLDLVPWYTSGFL